jgi:hypothetical protein
MFSNSFQKLMYSAKPLSCNSIDLSESNCPLHWNNTAPNPLSLEALIFARSCRASSQWTSSIEIQCNLCCSSMKEAFPKSLWSIQLGLRDKVFALGLWRCNDLLYR